jgi:hypothetical protein
MLEERFTSLEVPIYPWCLGRPTIDAVMISDTLSLVGFIGAISVGMWRLYLRNATSGASPPAKPALITPDLHRRSKARMRPRS